MAYLFISPANIFGIFSKSVVSLSKMNFKKIFLKKYGRPFKYGHYRGSKECLKYYPITLKLLLLGIWGLMILVLSDEKIVTLLG